MLTKKATAVKIINETLILLEAQYESFENKSSESEEDYQLIYILEQNRSLLDDIRFFIFALENDWNNKTASTVRVSMHKIIKLIYLTHLSKEKCEDYVKKDMMEMARKLYRLSKTNKEKNMYESYYKEFITDDYLNKDISDLESRIISFPDMKAMINTIFPKDSNMYITYEILSEYAHGNILFSISNNLAAVDNSTIYLMGSFLLELLKLNDWSLNEGNFSQEVKSFLHRCKRDLDKFSN